MKRFSKSISLVFLVVLLSLSLVACTSTKKVEAPVTEVVEEVQKVTTPTPEPVVTPAPEPTTTPTVEAATPKVAVSNVVAPILDFNSIAPIVKDNSGKADFDLYVIHTNDVHGRVDNSEDRIGYAKFATLVKWAKSYTKDVLVLDAGDVLHGTNFANYFEGASIGNILQMIGYDAICPGNHDYDYGYEKLLDYTMMAEKYSDTKVLCANVMKDNKLLFQPYQIYDYNGFKVAVIGLTTPDTTVKSSPKNTVGLTFINQQMVKYAQTIIDQAHEVADFVVILGHMGVTADGPSGLTSTLICQSVNGIDLFVDGHSHTVLPNGKEVNGAVIVQAGEYFEHAGLVQIKVEDGKAVSIYPLLVNASDVNDPANSDLAKYAGVTDVPEDLEVANYIKKTNVQLGKVLDQVIANVTMNLNGEREDVRTRPTNLSKIITTAVAKETGADVVLLNGGGIRASIPAGKVTLGDVNTVLPFGNIAVTTTLSGAEIYAAFEHGYEMLPETNGAFTQSNVDVVYNSKAEVGSRILRLYLNGKEINKKANYTVATNDFMSIGGDGYDMFTGKECVDFGTLDKIVEDYLSMMYPVK